MIARCAVIVVAGLLAYANGLDGPFVFDDYRAIVQNQTLRDPSLSAALSPPRETPVAGRPLVNLSLAINYAAGGMKTRGYHVTNLVIHLLAALVLLGVIRRTLELGGGHPRLHAHALDIAFVSALIWMLHPLQSEVVNYVTQRTTSMAGLALLVTLYCSIRALGSPPGRWTAAAVLACAAGMACKESAAIAPVLVVLVDRVFVFGSLRQAFAVRRVLYTGLAASWVVVIALLAQEPRTTVGFGGSVTAWTYLLNQTTVIVDYLRLTVWPRALVLDYGLPRALTLREVLPQAVAVALLGVLTLAALVRRPRAGFLGAWFFITLAPTSSIVPIVTEVGAERRMYLALAAVVVFAVCAGFLALTARRVSRTAAVAVVAAVCLLLGAGTILRNGEYDSRLALAQTVVERRPHGRAYFRFGSLLIDAGRRAEALDYFRRAKSLDFVGSSFALGTEHLVDGDVAAGVRELTDFVTRNPLHINAPEAREMLGRAFLSQGRPADAERELALVLRELPNHDGARQVMGDVLLSQNRVVEALPHLQHTAAVLRHDVAALGKLGTALAATGRLEEATAVFRDAVGVAPQNRRARTMLGRALAARGLFREAVAEFERLVQIAPDDADARRMLGAARLELARRGGS